MRGTRLVLALGLTLAFGERSLAALMVVRTIGPSASLYPAGAILDDRQIVSLKKGDRLTLLDGAGTRVVVGPMAGKLAAVSTGRAAARGTIDELRQIFNRANDRRSVLGASRGILLPPDVPRSFPSSLWAINLDKGGTWCVPASLTRENGQFPATVEMRTAGQDIRVDLQKGATVARLPAMTKGDTFFCQPCARGHRGVRQLPCSAAPLHKAGPSGIDPIANAALCGGGPELRENVGHLRSRQPNPPACPPSHQPLPGLQGLIQ